MSVENDQGRDSPRSFEHAPRGRPADGLSPIEEILDELRRGRMVVVVDGEDRENEGDLAIAAEFVSAEIVNFMIREAGGYLFLSLPEADCDRLELHPQAPVNTAVRGTPFTVSIDGHPKHGFTTGVSATERARTVLLAIDESSSPADFVRPGHINPLRSRDGGVLVRTGHTEAVIDLCRLAGVRPAALGIEICRKDGEMARLPDLLQFCNQHGFKICSIAQLIEYRLQQESLVTRLEPAQGRLIMTEFGEFTLLVFESQLDSSQHLVLTCGGVGRLDSHGQVVATDAPTLVRLHRQTPLADILGAAPNRNSSRRRLIDCCLAALQQEKTGVFVYLGSDKGRRGFLPDDAPASAGDVQSELGIGGRILRELGMQKLRLLTERPHSPPGLEARALEACGLEACGLEACGLEACGLEIVENVPIPAM